MSRSACKGFARSRNLSIFFSLQQYFSPGNIPGLIYFILFIYHFYPTYHKETAHLWKISPNPYLDFPHFPDNTDKPVSKGKKLLINLCCLCCLRRCRSTHNFYTLCFIQTFITQKIIRCSAERSHRIISKLFCKSLCKNLRNAVFSMCHKNIFSVFPQMLSPSQEVRLHLHAR